MRPVSAGWGRKRAVQSPRPPGRSTKVRIELIHGDPCYPQYLCTVGDAKSRRERPRSDRGLPREEHRGSRRQVQGVPLCRPVLGLRPRARRVGLQPLCARCDRPHRAAPGGPSRGGLRRAERGPVQPLAHALLHRQRRRPAHRRRRRDPARCADNDADCARVRWHRQHPRGLDRHLAADRQRDVPDRPHACRLLVRGL
eukprot:4595720-Prymnesium_polylepis.1